MGPFTTPHPFDTYGASAPPYLNPKYATVNPRDKAYGFSGLVHEETRPYELNFIQS